MSDTGEPFDPYYHWLGIPPEEQPPNHYRLLGIQLLEGNQAVIQNAADRQMAHLRTFQTGPHAALSQRILNELAAARVCLLTPERKAEYDESLREAEADSFQLVQPTPPMVSVDVNGPPAPPAAGVELDVSLGGPRAMPVKRRIRKRRTNNITILTLIIGGLLSIAIVVAAAVMWLMPAKTEATRLILNWPSEGREGATLLIDGKLIDLSKAENVTDKQVELSLAAGSHKYRITRPPPLESVNGQFEIRPAQRLEIDILLPPVEGAPQRELAELVLVWPERDRARQVLRIDNQVYDLTEDNVTADASAVRVTLPTGAHRVALLEQGKVILSRMAKVGNGQPMLLSKTSTLHLVWSKDFRDGVTVNLDGAAIELKSPGVTDSGSVLSVPIEQGTHQLEILRGGKSVHEQPLAVSAGGRITISVDAILTSASPRLVLVWPTAERKDAVLRIDGGERALPSGTDGSSELVFELEPGEHRVTVSRPGFDDFERLFVIGEGVLRTTVDLQPMPALTSTAEELQKLRDEFVKTYIQFTEFRMWSEETDPGRRREALSRLVSAMSTAASRMERSSAEQYVAFDETFRMAADQGDLLGAGIVAERMRSYRCITQDELESRQDELWSLAVNEADFYDALPYFRTALAAGRKLSAEELASLRKRIAASPALESDYASLEQIIVEFEKTKLFDADVSVLLRADLMLSALEVARLDPSGTVELAEKILDLIPALLESTTEEGLLKADALLDAANTCRRRVLADRSSPARLAPQIEEIRGTLKALEEQVDRHRRVVEAQQAVTAGSATASQHKLFGLWLLEKAEFAEALPHLRKSNDSALAAISIPLPDSAQELANLADAIEAESKKTRYSERTQTALLAYSHFVRQRARAHKDVTGSGEANPAVFHVDQ